MDKQLTDLVIKWVDKAGGAIGQGLDFAIQEAPEIFKQYMEIQAIDAIYYVCISCVWILMGIILVLLGLFKKMDSDGFGKVVSFIVGLGAIAISTGVGFNNLAKYYKIKEAPKAYMMIKVADYYACREKQAMNQCSL